MTSKRSVLRPALRVLAPLVLGGSSVLAAPTAPDLAAAGLDTLLDLEVTGASKLALRASESPATATVVTAEQMRQLGHRTLADVLRSVRGTVVSSDRTYSYVGVRGFALPGDYNTRVLVLIDGNRVNDSVYEQGFLGHEFPLDLDLVERVEFIHGQGSAAHGANALFGVVNVVTRRGGVAVGREVAVGLGRGAERQLRATGHLPIRTGTDLLLSATLRRVAGTDVEYPGAGSSHETDHERGRQLFAKLTSGELSATLLHGDRRKGLSSYPETVFGDPRSRLRDTHTLADLAWKHRLGSAGTFTLRGYSGRYDFQADYLIDYPPLSINRDTAASRWWGVDAHFSTERFAGHRLVVGADLQRQSRRDQANLDVWPDVVGYLDDRRSSWRQSLFVEDQWQAMPALTLGAGLRLDRQQGSDPHLSPRLSAVWRASEAWTLRAVHGSAFRPPNAYELYYGGSDSYKGNPDAASERVRGIEVAAEYRPDATTRVSLAVFSNRLTGLLVQDIDPADGALVFRNAGRMHLRGVDLEVEHAFAGGGLVRANVANHHVHDLSGLGLDQHSPRRLAKLVLLQPLAAGWTLGLEGVAIGRRGDVAGHALANVTLSSLVLADRALLSVSVYDLFDRQASDPGGDSVLQPTAPHDGRSLRIKLETRF